MKVSTLELEVKINTSPEMFLNEVAHALREGQTLQQAQLQMISVVARHIKVFKTTKKKPWYKRIFAALAE